MQRPFEPGQGEFFLAASETQTRSIYRRAAKSTQCTPKEYALHRAAGERWCGFGKHWVPSDRLKNYGARMAQKCLDCRHQKETT